MGDRPDKDLFGIYIHWPFCAAKCPYCDFNSHVAETIDHEAWRKAYARELASYATLTPGREVTSIFFGGGTPSLMEPETVQAIIDGVAGHWPVSKDCEITLEANPTSVEREKFYNFRTAGVNRVSIGVQSLRERDLNFLGRKHDAAEARMAIETAAKVFDRYTFDLIYARPEQTAVEWEAELRECLAMAGGHLSLYQLTIEKGTPFYMRHERGDFKIPAEDIAGDMYELTQSVMKDAGLAAYEVSNHAAPGQESRHNLAYWRYADYVGVGPGAHGRLTLDGVKKATRGHRAPDVWLKQAGEDGSGAHPFEELSSQDRFHEALLMGLRLKEGVPMKRLEAETGQAWQTLFDERKIKALCDEGLLRFEDETLIPTDSGLQRLNGILNFLL